MKKVILSHVATLLMLLPLYNCSGDTTDTPDVPQQEEPGSSDDDQTGETPDDETEDEDQTKTYPDGVTVSPFADDLGDGDKCSGFIAEVDFASNENLKFNVGYEGYKMTATEFFSRFNRTATSKGKPCIVINGGYFSGATSVSLAVIGSSVRCHNMLSMNWPSDQDAQKTVYPVRSAVGQMDDGSFEAQWVYCVRPDFKEYYSFPSALGNNEKTGTFMESAPTTETPGGQVWKPVEAIGGGPRLVADGQNVAVENYWAEVLDSGGTAGLSRQPRTGIGYTEDGKLIMIVCDGRGMNGSSGFTLSELADKFISLGATDAINLDGGGSSEIVGHDGSVLNRPSDTGNNEEIVERDIMTAVIITEMQK